MQMGSGNQSVLDPRGPGATLIANLTWATVIGAAVIFLLVVALLVYVLLTKPEKRYSISENVFILAGGVILPVITLSVLLFFVFRIGAELTAEPEDPLVVEVTGHQWWWEVQYKGDDGAPDMTTANELHIPIGRPVKLQLESSDVIHSFWVPNIGGKRDAIPGVTNTLILQADEPGVFLGQCNEFCGAQHALMRIRVVAETPADFDQWLESQRQPARTPTDDTLQIGKATFLTNGCDLCHRIRGTEANGGVAPDLTHFGSRATIAAGTLANTQGNREAWVVSAQHLKPGNKMPNNRLQGDRLRALAAYLGSLE